MSSDIMPSSWQLVRGKLGTRIQIILCFFSSWKNHKNRAEITDALVALALATFVLEYGKLALIQSTPYSVVS